MHKYVLLLPLMINGYLYASDMICVASFNYSKKADPDVCAIAAASLDDCERLVADYGRELAKADDNYTAMTYSYRYDTLWRYAQCSDQWIEDVLKSHQKSKKGKK